MTPVYSDLPLKSLSQCQLIGFSLLFQQFQRASSSDPLRSNPDEIYKKELVSRQRSRRSVAEKNVKIKHSLQLPKSFNQILQGELR